jgi:thymidylate synthase (FAD)
MNNDCFVKLISVVGTDYSIALSSYAKPWLKSRYIQYVKNFLKKLLKQKNTSSFEKTEMLFHIRIPIYMKNQWIENETSHMFSQPNKGYDFENLLSDSVRDATGWPICNDSEYLAEELANKCNDFCKSSFDMYYHLIEQGMAPEQAQRVLPLSSWTEMYWKVDLLSLMRYITKYFDDKTPIDITYIYELIEEHIMERFPLTFSAWSELRKEENRRRN